MVAILEMMINPYIYPGLPSWKKDSKDESTLINIRNKVCSYFGIELFQLLSKSKTTQIAKARAIIIYFATKKTKLSYQKIGSKIGLTTRAAITRLRKTFINDYTTSTKFREDVEKILYSFVE